MVRTKGISVVFLVMPQSSLTTGTNEVRVQGEPRKTKENMYAMVQSRYEPSTTVHSLILLFNDNITSYNATSTRLEKLG